jgi:hypothetical protein
MLPIAIRPWEPMACILSGNKMSKVALIVGTLGESKVDVVKLLRSYLGLELWRIMELAGSGRPMIERELFDRADPKFTSSLQVVLSQLEKLRVYYDAYEILDEQQFTLYSSFPC